MITGTVIATILLLIFGWVLFGPIFAIYMVATMGVVVMWCIVFGRICFGFTSAVYEELSDNTQRRNEDSEI